MICVQIYAAIRIMIIGVCDQFSFAEEADHVDNVTLDFVNTRGLPGSTENHSEIFSCN